MAAKLTSCKEMRLEQIWWSLVSFNPVQPQTHEDVMSILLAPQNLATSTYSNQLVLYRYVMCFLCNNIQMLAENFGGSALSPNFLWVGSVVNSSAYKRRGTPRVTRFHEP